MSQNQGSYWEYEVVSLSDQLGDAAIKGALDELGKTGWELTGVHPGVAGCPRYVFKRRVGGSEQVEAAGHADTMDDVDEPQERWLRNVSISEALLALPEDKCNRLVAEVLTEEERMAPAPPDDFYERVMLYFAQEKHGA